MKRELSEAEESTRLRKRSRSATAENMAIRNIAKRFRDLGMGYLSREEPYQDAIKSLLSEFNLWTAVNGVFAESDASLDSRLAKESDDTNSEIIVSNLRIMCMIMASSTKWSSPQPAEDIRAVLNSLHDLGASLAAAYPSNRLVYKVTEVFKPVHYKGKLPKLFDHDDVVDEMKRWYLGFDAGTMETIAESICKEYQVVFAILLLIYKPMQILDCIKETLDDTKLPFKTRSSGKSNSASKSPFQFIGLTTKESGQFLHYQQIFKSRYPDYFSRNTQRWLQVHEESSMRTSPLSIQTQRNDQDDAESPQPIKQPRLQLPPSDSRPTSPSSMDHQQFIPKRQTILDEISYLDLNISASVPITGNLAHYERTPQKHEEFLLGNTRERTPPKLPPGYMLSVNSGNWDEFSQESALQAGWRTPSIESSA